MKELSADLGIAREFKALDRLERLFADKERAFWVLQTLGWAAYGVVRFLNGLSNGRAPRYLLPSLMAMAIGFVITLGLRKAYRALRPQPLSVTLPVTGLLISFSALLFSAVETQAHVAFYERFWNPSLWELFGNAMMDAYVLLSWTALYYSINYYLLMQKERERTLTALAMAHEAQLKMLRYQLNPHFLFNTLNAISTLVLMKETGQANQMLNRLSSFLRTTLVVQPEQKVPLSQELQILGLYLDIERVRFGERLRVEYDVSEKARDALVPCLLLQPLIENAIKYAIAPSESGGRIAISAQVCENRLLLEISDDGPGLKATEGKDRDQANLSSGVGLENTRQRLRQIYGDDQRIFVDEAIPHGVEISIGIPFERQD